MVSKRREERVESRRTLDLTRLVGICCLGMGGFGDLAVRWIDRKERKGKERKGKERKGKEREGRLAVRRWENPLHLDEKYLDHILISKINFFSRY